MASWTIHTSRPPEIPCRPPRFTPLGKYLLLPPPGTAATSDTYLTLLCKWPHHTTPRDQSFGREVLPSLSRIPPGHPNMIKLASTTRPKVGHHLNSIFLDPRLYEIDTYGNSIFNPCFWILKIRSIWWAGTGKQTRAFLSLFFSQSLVRARLALDGATARHVTGL